MENLWRDLMSYEDFFTAPKRIHRRNIHPLWSSELAQTMTTFIKKPPEQSRLCSDVVRPSGFEPLAFRLGGGRSILLSYGRIKT